jgi:hypothetical protein
LDTNTNRERMYVIRQAKFGTNKTRTLRIVVTSELGERYGEDSP